MYNGIYLCILVPLYEEKLIYFPPLYRTGICPVKEGDFVLKGWRFYADSCIIE